MHYLAIFLVLNLAACQNDFRLLTWNIRLDTSADGVNQWQNRRRKVVSLLQRYDPGIFGVQEALHNQMTDLATSMPAYSWCGVGRDDGKTAGEYSAIFYKKEKFTLLQSGTFWLSQTPEVPGSKSWDAAITRICSWAEFSDKVYGRTFFVFNTHFDHIGEIARLESMKLLSEKARQIAGDAPFVLMGDFNFEPTAAPYQVVNDIARWKIRDAYLAAGKNEAKNSCTRTGFKVDGAECRRIDYVFASEIFEVTNYSIIVENDGTYFPSDHLPVLAELAFSK
jgi:endonuclease/exonuclease/phosphatase family metal-dependent hydrolase